MGSGDSVSVRWGTVKCVIRGFNKVVSLVPYRFPYPHLISCMSVEKVKGCSNSHTIINQILCPLKNVKVVI